jgi:hypothetical protein
MESIVIKIQDKEYELRKTNKGIIIYETLSGKFVSELENGIGFTDTMMLFYSFLKGANRNTFIMSFDEFCDEMDKENEIQINSGEVKDMFETVQLTQFNKFMSQQTKTSQTPTAKKKQK